MGKIVGGERFFNLKIMETVDNELVVALTEVADAHEWCIFENLHSENWINFGIIFLTLFSQWFECRWPFKRWMKIMPKCNAIISWKALHANNENCKLVSYTNQPTIFCRSRSLSLSHFLFLSLGYCRSLMRCILEMCQHSSYCIPSSRSSSSSLLSYSSNEPLCVPHRLLNFNAYIFFSIYFPAFILFFFSVHFASLDLLALALSPIRSLGQLVRCFCVPHIIIIHIIDFLFLC